MDDRPRYKRDSKWYEAREAEQEAAERWRNAVGWWCAKHPGCCPYCGRPESVHGKLGGCPHFLEEDDDNSAYSEEGDDSPDLGVVYRGEALQLRPVADG